MSEPTTLSLLKEDLDRTRGRVDGHDKEIGEIKDELVMVPALTKAFWWVVGVLGTAIVAVIAAAVTVLVSAGGPK